MKPLVVIPTYNEIENIEKLIQKIREEYSESLDLLVVDDSSPDGTSKKVEEISKSDPQVHLLLREKKEGLGRAYIAGFKWGLEKGFDLLIEMDADFSHNPKYLKNLLEVCKEKDFAIGSRYVPGGGTVNWGWGRKIVSRGGSFYSSLVLGYPIRDWTGGFNAWNARIFQKIDLESIRSDGYSFQIELKYKALRAGFECEEVPIVFADRTEGKSKMSSSIVLEAIYRVWGIRFN